MNRFFLLVMMLSIILPSTTYAIEETNVKAGFLRDGDLWTFISNKEKQITNTGNVIAIPKWSPDGNWLLYQIEATSKYEDNTEQVELWAYNVENEERKKIYHNAHAPSWSPHKNEIAFRDAGILNISDLERFYNIATGVTSYSWLPDGSGFILSSSGVLRPDGWSSATIYKKKVNEDYEAIDLFGGARHFFTLPKEIGTNTENKIIAVNASDLEFSPSKKWISFIVSPTASWSMDSNMLCVITSDGNDFEVLDEVIFGVGEPKWAPTHDTIAYIAGGGRIVFGFKNKDLKIREMPTNGSYTPPNYVDLDFDWVTDKSIVTSRMEESEWSNDFSKHPLPSLYSINIDNNKQVKLTEPPKGYGDYSPQYIHSMDKIVWLRGTSIIDKNRNLWLANPDGTGAEEWIENVDEVTFFLRRRVGNGTLNPSRG